MFKEITKIGVVIKRKKPHDSKRFRMFLRKEGLPKI